MKHLFSLLLGIFLISACASPQLDSPEEKSSPQDFSSPYSFKLTGEPGLGWGYVIEQEGKEIIRQPHVPGVPGNHPFQTSEDASAVARLVVLKLQASIFPPTIQIRELDSLGVNMNFD